uniref:START domain-containing protein n=1 Tax=Globisporangium ultimum (strain ATCC 200006 / CBS 805.95 / DAOM BR144) TaxID=431595 RepID=K3W5B4_GLOUD
MFEPSLAATTDQYSIRFAPDPLRDLEREKLVTLGHREFADLFATIRFARSSGFGTKVRSSARSTRATICVPTQIHATLEEVADVFFSDRTNAAIGFAASQQIYSLVEPSDERPLRACGLRWSLWHSPSKLVRQRDILYIEYMDTFVDENGRRGWARVTRSIHHRSCPPLLHSHNVVRAHLGCSGTTYTETDTPGVLDVVTLYDCDTKGVPAWLTKFVAVRKAKNAHLLEHLIRLARAANDSLVADFTKLVPAKQEKACVGCGDALPKWNVGGRKCRECKENVCKSCSDIVYCAVEGGKKLNRICMHCVDRYLSTDVERSRVDMYTQLSTSSSSSSSRPRKASSYDESAPSNGSTRRRRSRSSNSHSGSTDGADLDSPLPMLEDKPSSFPPSAPSSADSRQYGLRERAATQAARKQPPKLLNLGVSRYRERKPPSGDIDLSYLASFKTVSSRS